jgi:pimeloyl-ACP methyl ester carboxylesterase
MGGLVVLETLNRLPQLEAGRVVLLGTPANGCFAGRRIARHAAGRWFLGKSEGLWREGRAAQWRRPEALGIVAGSLPLGLGRLFGALPGVNDGVVSLEETSVEGMAGRTVLPVGHSQMLFSARVAEQIAVFLAHGKFEADSH